MIRDNIADSGSAYRWRLEHWQATNGRAIRKLQQFGLPSTQRFSTILLTLPRVGGFKFRIGEQYSKTPLTKVSTLTYYDIA